jgi:hypothetical protein
VTSSAHRKSRGGNRGPNKGFKVEEAQGRTVGHVLFAVRVLCGQLIAHGNHLLSIAMG